MTASHDDGGGARRDRLRFALWWVAPPVLLLLAVVLALVRGTETLYLRDVFGTHLEMKWAQAEAMRDGRLPLIDPYRSNGQPHLGNPNTVPLYPDNLLYLVASPLWALNAHFWLHLLLAPAAAFWMARAWGLGRESAWITGVAFGAGGYFLSTLNLYNLVAGAALAPALVAALLDLSRGRRPGLSLAATALIWALLVLGGDPMTAAAGLLLAATALAVQGGRRAGWAAAGGAVALGTLLAAPQLVEFLRILPASYRGYWGYSAEAVAMASWHPATALEWLLPLAFGRPDLGFWGRALHGGEQPLLFSLAPGLPALLLLLCAGRPRRPVGWWAWGGLAAGLFLALGGHNPILAPLLRLPGLGLLRFPVKLWIVVAVAAALLAGLGFERVFGRGERRRFYRVAALAAAVYLGFWAFLSFGSAGAAVLRRWVPADFSGAWVEAERVRWAGICLLSLTALVLLVAACRLAARRPAWGAVPALVQVGLQLLLLRPLLATEPVAVYRAPPPLLERVPEESLVVHGDAGRLFGEAPVPVDSYPDSRLSWLRRQTYQELHPWAGALWGRRYEFSLSAEGLDSFLTRAAAHALRILEDDERLRLLAASGVDVLLLRRDLEPEAVAGGQARLAHVMPSVGGALRVYEISGPAAPAQFVGRVLRAPHLNAALAALIAPDFDPRTAAVLAGEGPATEGAGGTVEWIERGPEAMALRVEARSAGALVVQRALLPIYRAEVDGRPAPLVAANLHRIGLELAPGSHTVRIWVERGPLRLSLALALLAAAALPVAARAFSKRAATRARC